MSNISSNYIRLSSMGFVEFSKSPVGTKATYLLTVNDDARNSVSKTIKTACTRAKSKCVINTTLLLQKEPNGVWLETHILEATIID